MVHGVRDASCVSSYGLKRWRNVEIDSIERLESYDQDSSVDRIVFRIRGIRRAVPCDECFECVATRRNDRIRSAMRSDDLLVSWRKC